MNISRSDIDSHINQALATHFPEHQSDHHLQPSRCEATVILQDAIIQVINRTDITVQTKAQLIPVLLQDILQREIVPSLSKEKPLENHEIIVSLKETEDACRATREQMKQDGFHPTHLVALANGGWPIAYHFAKKYGMAAGALGYKSYSDKKAGALQDITSPAFPLSFSGLSDEELMSVHMLLIDDLTETSATVKQAKEKVAAVWKTEMDKRGLDIDKADFQLKVATLFAKDPEHFKADYVYSTKIWLDKRVTFLCETILQETQ